MFEKPIYRRILLKLSGELISSENQIICTHSSHKIISQIKKLIQENIEVAIVFGGGNILRGSSADFSKKITRRTSDSMGMLATIINGLAFKDLLRSYDIDASLYSAKPIDSIVSGFDCDQVDTDLKSKKVVVFSGGTGNPFVTTDSAASLRAIEINADVILKATTVDGVYDEDPKKNPNALKYQSLTFDKAISNGLQVMDSSAFLQCRDFNMPIYIFNMHEEDAILKVTMGESIGTLIHNKRSIYD